MKKVLTKFIKFWYFNISNPVIRRGETEAFRWVFRRFYLTIETRSGNWKARWTASEAPFAYLLAGKTDDNIIGFCRIMYTIGMELTTDREFAEAIGRAINDYHERVVKKNPIMDDETEEKIALEEVKQVQKYVESSEKETKRINRRFKKVVKDLEKSK